MFASGCTAARQAKKFHGTRCQACDLDFAERYGVIGKGFIEAHHLRFIGVALADHCIKQDGNCWRAIGVQLNCST